MNRVTPFYIIPRRIYDFSPFCSWLESIVVVSNSVILFDCCSVLLSIITIFTRLKSSVFLMTFKLINVHLYYGLSFLFV